MEYGLIMVVVLVFVALVVGVIYGIIVIAKTSVLLLASFSPSYGGRMASGIIVGCTGGAMLVMIQEHWSTITEWGPGKWIGVAIFFVILVIYCRYIYEELEICNDPIFISLQRDDGGTSL